MVDSQLGLEMDSRLDPVEDSRLDPVEDSLLDPVEDFRLGLVEDSRLGLVADSELDCRVSAASAEQVVTLTLQGGDLARAMAWGDWDQTLWGKVG